MKMSHETDRLPQPYTPTPDGFERRLRAWVRLPTDDGTTPDARDASAPPQEPGARVQTGRMTHTRKGHRRRRKGGPDA
jgi:hypothetical protein